MPQALLNNKETIQKKLIKKAKKSNGSNSKKVELCSYHHVLQLLNKFFFAYLNYCLKTAH